MKRSMLCYPAVRLSCRLGRVGISRVALGGRGGDCEGEDLDPVGVPGDVVVGGLPGAVGDDGLVDLLDEQRPPALAGVGG